jgi:hypothetical protein
VKMLRRRRTDKIGEMSFDLKEEKELRLQLGF